MKLSLSPRTDLSIKLAYRSFLNTQQGTEEYEEFKRLLYTEDDSLVQVLNNNVLQYLPTISKDLLKVCDIGGGNGKRIRKILKFWHEKFNMQFKLDFIEQSSPFMRSFGTEDIDFFCETRRLEMLFEEAELASDFDVVFLVHSIFAFEDEKAVNKVLSLPRPGGTIVIVANAQDSFLAGLKRVLDAEYEDSRFEISDLVRVLENRALPFRQIQFETKWAVRKEALRRKAEVILDWLSLGRYKHLAEDRKKEVWRYIEENSLDVGQRVLFSESEVAVLVSCPQNEG